MAQQLVPITREFLREFYKKYPLAPLPPSISATTKALDEFLTTLRQNSSAVDQIVSILDNTRQEPPKRIDENIWKNREQCEEVIHTVKHSRSKQTLQDQEITSQLQAVLDDIQATFDVIVTFQTRSKQKVELLVKSFMPKDFRGTLLLAQQQKRERQMEMEVETLVKRGCTIREKYELLWKQQMRRRQTLVQIGQASGIFKGLLRYLVGVPQVLLDFVSRINDDQGPIEELRLCYGPVLYELTALAHRIRVATQALLQSLDEQAINATSTLVRSGVASISTAASHYRRELAAYLERLTEVWERSPFFVSASQLAQAQREADPAAPIEVMVSREYSDEIPLQAGSKVEWEFTTKDRDISFCVSFRTTKACVESIGADKNAPTEEGEDCEELVMPLQRVDSHCMPQRGTFTAPNDGVLRLCWDNSYSLFYKKKLSYRVAVAQPSASLEATQKF